MWLYYIYYTIYLFCICYTCDLYNIYNNTTMQKKEKEKLIQYIIQTKNIGKHTHSYKKVTIELIKRM